MAITSKGIAIVIDRIRNRMATLEDELNKADSELGDGDTGGMLTRFVGSLSQCDIAENTDLGGTFLTLAKAGANSTGSSFGTRIVTGLMAIGKEVQGRSAVELTELGGLFEIARDAMMARGNTELGSKTAIDSIDYLARALITSGSPEEIAENAVKAAEMALSDFRDRPCKTGRARMFSEKSIGLDDPGMLAIGEIVKTTI